MNLTKYLIVGFVTLLPNFAQAVPCPTVLRINTGATMPTSSMVPLDGFFQTFAPAQSTQFLGLDTCTLPVRGPEIMSTTPCTMSFKACTSVSQCRTDLKVNISVAFTNPQTDAQWNFFPSSGAYTPALKPSRLVTFSTGGAVCAYRYTQNVVVLKTGN